MNLLFLFQLCDQNTVRRLNRQRSSLHHKHIVLIINGKRSNTVGFRNDNSQMLVVREHHDILRISTTGGQTELRRQESRLRIDVKHCRGIDTSRRTEQMASVGSDGNSFRSIMSGISFTDNGAHTLNFLKMDILLIMALTIYIDFSGQLTDHIGKTA